MRGACFENLDEARAAFALGPMVFRCSVCGRAHRSAGGGWRPCARRLAAEWGLLWDGPGMRPLAFVFSRRPPLSPPVLGSPQVVLSVRREVLAGAVRDARAARERAMEQALKKLGARVAGEFAGPGRWQKAYSLRELEAAGLPESIASDIRSTCCWTRGAKALVWRSEPFSVVAIADVASLAITRGAFWTGGGKAVWWVLASTASAENLVRWMVHVLHAAGGRSGGGL